MFLTSYKVSVVPTTASSSVKRRNDTRYIGLGLTFTDLSEDEIVTDSVITLSSFYMCSDTNNFFPTKRKSWKSPTAWTFHHLITLITFLHVPDKYFPREKTTMILLTNGKICFTIVDVARLQTLSGVLQSHTPIVVPHTLRFPLLCIPPIIMHKISWPKSPRRLR